MKHFTLFINGELRDGAGSLDVINPATEEVVAACPRASHGAIKSYVAFRTLPGST